MHLDIARPKHWPAANLLHFCILFALGISSFLIWRCERVHIIFAEMSPVLNPSFAEQPDGGRFGLGRYYFVCSIVASLGSVNEYM